MRHILVLLLGIVIGTLAAISMSNAISQRNPVPRAIMVMMAYHQGQLARSLRRQSCDTGGLTAQLERLDSAAADIEPTFQGFDPGFGEAARHLRQQIHQTLTAPPASCKAWQSAMADIKEACDACHRQYR